jgi:hypothetical protein
LFFTIRAQAEQFSGSGGMGGGGAGGRSGDQPTNTTNNTGTINFNGVPQDASIIKIIDDWWRQMTDRYEAGRG